MIYQLGPEIIFPPVHLADMHGLLAVGGDLSPERLIAAYRQGIFPWYSDNDPLLWWFTSPRLILAPVEFHLPKRLAREIRSGRFTITFDQAFDQVIEACATTRTQYGEETWITKEMQEAYCHLHTLGYGHSVECWEGGKLAGGLYGIRLDRVFFGESMFTRISNASKVALTALVSLLKQQGVQLIDCQMTTRHLLTFGAREISGQNFSLKLQQLIHSNKADGNWNHDHTKC
ncbi:MAG: leucyl/phenylalanyl-tRNA--protein transferase [Desulfobulbaceae bacterium]|uniref:Leucyl/phenylalanyl-tRNA--protein transferase n=1 Tax=Candidatus Desulfatifera sulfidica TaxID=2841691 RepID=A0A8J6NBK4_9BACT|nr:leucyl/phenylalanyl-tRNA--protein transferase [Candidatus Desulfatifera sulfidica]